MTIAATVYFGAGMCAFLRAKLPQSVALTMIGAYLLHLSKVIA